jgi:hypothetical protein
VSGPSPEEIRRLLRHRDEAATSTSLLRSASISPRAWRAPRLLIAE